jgi:uncharacterized protein YcbX
MRGQVVALASYPVKGLSAQPHERVALRAGDGFPGDRMFGFAKGNSGLDPDNPTILPKDRFVVLFQYAALAGLNTTFEPDKQSLSITAADKATRRFDMTDPNDRDAACALLASLLRLAPDEAPFFAPAAPLRFTDVSVVSPTHMNAVSLINRASVAAFGAAIGQEIDPRRFRGNILIDGWPPMAELDLVGKEMRIGGARFRGLLRTKRCAATEVNPDTAERDIPLPYLLKKTYGHSDMGLYLEVLENGEIAIGDPVTLT